MHKLIYNHLKFTALLALQQLGFRTKRSTVCALIDVTHHWFQSLDEGKEICTVFFDLCKAFDFFLHRVLLQKIKSAGMNRHISNCLFSYLFNGGQLVVLNGSGVSIYSSFVAGIHAGSPIVFFFDVHK